MNMQMYKHSWSGFHCFKITAVPANSFMFGRFSREGSKYGWVSHLFYVNYNIDFTKARTITRIISQNILVCNLPFSGKLLDGST